MFSVCILKLFSLTKKVGIDLRMFSIIVCYSVTKWKIFMFYQPHFIENFLISILEIHVILYTWCVCLLFESLNSSEKYLLDHINLFKYLLHFFLLGIMSESAILETLDAPVVDVHVHTRLRECDVLCLCLFLLLYLFISLFPFVSSPAPTFVSVHLSLFLSLEHDAKNKKQTSKQTKITPHKTTIFN